MSFPLGLAPACLIFALIFAIRAKRLKKRMNTVINCRVYEDMRINSENLVGVAAFFLAIGLILFFFV